MRRAGIGLLIGVVLAGWASLASAQAKELVVAAWGGLQEAAWRKALIPNFEKKHGVKLIWVPGFSTQTLAKLRAQKDNPQIDVAMLDDGPHRQAVALGLVERVDRSRLSNAKDLYDILYEPEDYGIGFAVTGTGLWYNTKIFAENKWASPTSWLDLFRPEFKGKVGAHNIANANGLNLLLALNKIAGGTESNVDPGFAKVRELVPHVVNFDRSGETPTMIQQGLAVIGVWSQEVTVNLAAAGVPIQFVYPKEGFYGFKEIITIVKGRTNHDLVYKFIDHVLSKEEQENTARLVGFGPGNKQAKLDPETAKKVIYGSEFVNRMVVPNWTLVNANRAAWTERWNKEIERR
jgi:putative spermidine/putrescine transport system substrate-binding protein